MLHATYLLLLVICLYHICIMHLFKMLPNVRTSMNRHSIRFWQFKLL